MSPCFNSLKAIIYWKRFKDNSLVTHTPMYVGRKIKSRSLTLEEILVNTTLKFREINLKIDIEGSEYHVLEDILKNQEHINFLVIEFHEFDIMRDLIIDFVERLLIDIVHIHINNFGLICDDGTTTVVEITFARCRNSNNDTKNIPLILPNESDFPSNSFSKEVEITFI